MMGPDEPLADEECKDDGNETKAENQIEEIDGVEVQLLTEVLQNIGRKEQADLLTRLGVIDHRTSLEKRCAAILGKALMASGSEDITEDITEDTAEVIAEEIRALRFYSTDSSSDYSSD